MVAIVDQHGNPIEKEVLNEPQTARVAGLYQQFASHPVRGLTPPKLASILEEAERGDLMAQCDLFEDMEEKDGHIFAEMQKRKLSLMGLEWDIVPPRNASEQEKKAAALVKELIQDIPNLEDVILDAADAIGKGYSFLETEWHQLERHWLPKEITHQPQRWFMLDRDSRTEFRLRNNTNNGEALLPFGWIQHIHKAKSGHVSRASLHRVLAWPFLFKNYSVRDLAEFLEIYGLPLRLGTYPNGASDKEKSTLLKAVINIGHAAAGIVPEGMMIDFKEAAKGNKDPFEAMINWCERTQSKAILGATLTSQTDGGKGAYALGNIHNEVRLDVRDADARQLASTLTRDLVYPIAALNVSGIDGLRRCPHWVFDTQEPEDLKLYSEAIPTLVDVGMKIPAKHIHDKLRIPQPEKDEEVLQRTSLAQTTGLASQQHCSHCATAALKAGNQQDVADHYTDQLDDATEDALASLIEPARRLVMQAKSLDEIRDSLLSIYEDMDAETLANVMRDAFLAAELAGRFEVNKGD